MKILNTMGRHSILQKHWLLLLLLLGLSACVTTSAYKDLEIVDKNKLEGFVLMGADYDGNDNPIIDFEQAVKVAALQCNQWHYKGATPREGYELTCIAGVEEDCQRYRIVYTYQCLTEQDLKDYAEGVFKFKAKIDRP